MPQHIMKQQYDFLAIGDIMTDAFIRLKEATVHCDGHNSHCELCMRFAEKIPYEEAFVIPAVGNSANAAVAAARLGLKSALVANIGKDWHGNECLKTLKEEGVGTEHIRAHEGRKTNYHYVLWYNDDRTILIKHEKFEYALPDIGSPRWAYFSSVGEDTLPFHHAVESYLAARPEVKLAFQPGTFQIKFGKSALKGIYERAEVVFCNVEEAQRILETKEEDIRKLLGGMRGLGPRIAVITDGTKGAYAREDNVSWFIPPYPDPKPPLERTGAGDAFSSTFTAALALGKPVREALRWAPINSMSVVQYVGAREGLLSRKSLEEYLAAAPAEYVPRQIQLT